MDCLLSTILSGKEGSVIIDGVILIWAKGDGLSEGEISRLAHALFSFGLFGVDGAPDVDAGDGAAKLRELQQAPAIGSLFHIMAFWDIQDRL